MFNWLRKKKTHAEYTRRELQAEARHTEQLSAMAAVIDHLTERNDHETETMLNKSRRLDELADQTTRQAGVIEQLLKENALSDSPCTSDIWIVSDEDKAKWAAE